MLDKNAFENKVVFIAGGTSGINLGIAKGFAQCGAKVAILGRNPEKGQQAAADIKAEAGTEVLSFAADVRDPEAIDACYQTIAQQWGSIDVVISGAAGNFLAPAVGLSPKGFKTVVDIDLLGTYNVFHSAFNYLTKGNASLIAITAGQAVNPMPQQAHVCAAKAGINMLVKCLAMEWGPAGIRVNGISPGPIEGTEGMTRLAPTEAAVTASKRVIPMRRWGRKDEIAHAAQYLSSPFAAYINGTILDVDGGFQLGDSSADCINKNDEITDKGLFTNT